MSSVYDALHVRPKLHKKLQPQREALAQAIVVSGKMRLDADSERNFVRLQLSREDLTFTLREMTDARLLPRAQERLKKALAKGNDEQKAAELYAHYIEKIAVDFKKLHPVPPKTELMLARALVLSNAIAVLRLIHLEGAEIYISYGHQIGDVMDIESWQKHGANSGMQSPGRNAIYVTCGGHPFLTPDEYRHSGDGPAALARFMIIAGQETGHNADIIRDAQGRWIGRYSAEDGDRAPREKVQKARLDDIRRVEDQYRSCRRMGLLAIAEWERQLQFYREHKVTHGGRKAAWLKSRLAWLVFALALYAAGLGHVASLQRDPYPATLRRRFFEDMLFNLAPVADVYRNPDPRREEAIACIEAVARVPQQAVKWGFRAVHGASPALYHFYYRTVVPACVAAVRRQRPGATERRW